jgi:hypothetical protein
MRCFLELEKRKCFFRREIKFYPRSAPNLQVADPKPDVFLISERFLLGGRWVLQVGLVGGSRHEASSPRRTAKAPRIFERQER